MCRLRLCFLLVGFLILLDAPAKAQCRLVMNPATSHLDCIWPIASSATNGLVYWDGTKLTSTATGGAGTLCLTSTNGAAPSFGACSGSAATAFSAITTSVNSSATMTLGTGATLTFTGTGVLNANEINGTALSSLGTGILKNTTGTGVPSIAVAGDFPTLNQNTTGTAAALAATPTQCPTGEFAQGIDIYGNSQNCGASLGSAGRDVLSLGAKCDGVTDDSAAIQTAATTAGTWYFPAGATCIVAAINDPTTSGVHWIGQGTTLKHKTGDTTNCMLLFGNGTYGSASDIALTGFKFDQNEVVIVGGGDCSFGDANASYIIFSGTTGILLDDNTFLNSGANTGNEMNNQNAIYFFEADGTVRNCQIQSTIVGNNYGQFRVLSGPPQSSLKFYGNTFTGGQWIQIGNYYNGAGSYGHVDIDSNVFNQVGQQPGNTGQTGNAILFYQATETANVARNKFYAPAFSAVRINQGGTGGAHIVISDNIVDSAGEVSLYCEFGCEGVAMNANHIMNGDAGIECTNVSNRLNSIPCQLNGNVIENMKAYGIHIEQDSAVGNTVANSPVGIELFFGNGMLASSNTFNNVAVPILVDPGISASAPSDQVAGNIINTIAPTAGQWQTLTSVTPQAHQAFAADAQADLNITGITQATTAGLTFSTTTPPVAGSGYLIRNIYGMTQIDGLICTIAASPAPTATTASCSNINSTGFSPVVNSPYGVVAGWANQLYSSGTTPAHSMPAAIVGLQ